MDGKRIVAVCNIIKSKVKEAANQWGVPERAKTVVDSVLCEVDDVY